MQPITIIQFAVRVGAYVRTNTDAPCMFIDLMHVMLTARKQRVYSKLVFKTYMKALCNLLRKLSKRNVEFHCKAQCANTQ